MLKNSPMKNDKFVYLTKMLFYTIKKKIHFNFLFSKASGLLI